MFAKPRFEFKYVTNLQILETLRERLADSMTPDPNVAGDGYQVNSIYYDTPEFNCYYEKLDGEKRRFKVRARWYGQLVPETDLSQYKVFVEIKHRNNDMNFKNRVAVSAELLPELVNNQNRLLQLEEVCGNSQIHKAATIKHIISQKLFYPTCIVSYHRRPFVCRFNPRLRVTFDTHIRVYGSESFLDTAENPGIRVLPNHLSVVEIKFNWAMPLWLIEICQEVGLHLRRYSKYASSLETLIPQFAERTVRFQEALP